MKFCPNCGNKLDDASDFCSNCGNKMNNNSSNESKQTKFEAPNNSNSLMSKPIIIAIAVIIVLAAIFLIGGASSNELVDVTSIDMSLGYYDTPFGQGIASATNGNYQDYQVGSAITKFSLMPRETITRVTGLAVSNIEVDLGNGKTENWGTYTFEPKDMYVENVNYDFEISRELGDMGESIEDYNSISHIKADIVINTTDAKNMVIGHINEDITIQHQ